MKVGEFQVALDKGGIIIPKQFEISNQKVKLIFVRERELLYLQLWTDLTDKSKEFEDMEEEGVERIKEYIVDCEEDGFVQLPEEFLELRKEDKEVIVIGMMDYLELYFPWQISVFDAELAFDVLEELLNEL